MAKLIEATMEKVYLDDDLDLTNEPMIMMHSRLRAIEHRSPELFKQVEQQPRSAHSVPYRDRVEQILKTREQFQPSESKAVHYDRINLLLYNKLEAQSVLAVNVVQAQKKKRYRKKKVPQIPRVTKEHLPIQNYKQQILDMIENNQVVLIRGETGSGKTTQVPQFILDSFINQKRATDCRIMCTQPRRIAAISVASRVAQERAEKLGGGSVGYLIRAENEMPRSEGGTIVYCTVGVLLRQMQSDPAFKKASHIIVDEIHERSTDSDVLLAALKMLLPLRPDLRVIVMSATIEMDQFKKYFDDCPSLDVAGKNYVVQEIYLNETEKLINAKFPLVKTPGLSNTMLKRTQLHFVQLLIQHIHSRPSPGAILVFCAGYDDIMELRRALKGLKDDTIKIGILHSLVPVRNDRIFERAQEGTRKVILSTNVAESSITIEDVVFVVDMGRVKVMNYVEEKEFYALQNVAITQANATQRKGRAGRCQNGIVYRLYNKDDYDKMTPSIRASVTLDRLDLLMLNLKVWNFGPVEAFIQTLITPPSETKVKNCLLDLQRAEALDENFELTKLGRQFVHLNMEPQLARMMIYASIFNCVEPISAVVAFLSFKDIFMLPTGQSKRAATTAEEMVDLFQVQMDLDGGMCSDHMIRVKALQEFKSHEQLSTEEKAQFCKETHLNRATLTQVMAMQSQIIKNMERRGFISKRDKKNISTGVTKTCDNYVHMIRSVIGAGLVPNMTRMR